MKTVVIGILGTVKDLKGLGKKRWKRWRPTVSVVQQDFHVDRFEILGASQDQPRFEQLQKDILTVSPKTESHYHAIEFQDPWDFETVYAALLDFAKAYPFQTDTENYLIHITTGTHVVQICLYLLIEAGYLPGKLLQSSPTHPNPELRAIGTCQMIDLDLSKYDLIASRFQKEHLEGANYLKSGIHTRNKDFNQMIDQIEKVSIRSKAPILLSGPTGAGKSQLAKRIYALKKKRGQLTGALVSVNCATLRGDNLISTLFGHKKGAFTGAGTNRAGLLKEADHGLIFLDEIGELGLNEQAMLLKALEEKRYLPLGADQEISSNFQLIAGTNQDLYQRSQQNQFRADLLARIDLWHYQLPSLKERLEDLEPNIEFEIELFAKQSGNLVRFSQDGKKQYLQFAQSSEAKWLNNFRDLNSSITRMATLANGGRITPTVVTDEILRLQQKWQRNHQTQSTEKKTQTLIAKLIGTTNYQALDRYDQEHLEILIRASQSQKSLAAVGRILFDKSRLLKKTQNDSHRIRQLFSKYNIRFEAVQQLLHQEP